MLTSEVVKKVEAGASARDVATELAGRLMADADLLRAELGGCGPLTRRRFCELFGIGESTLTGWLQTEKIPQSTATAYVLFLLSTELLKRIGEDREQSRIIALPEGFAIAKFLPGQDGQPVGKLIASGIKDLHTARKLAFAQSDAFSNLVARQTELLEEQIDSTIQAGNDAPYRMAQLDKELEALKRVAKAETGRKAANKPDKTRAKSSVSTERGAS